MIERICIHGFVYILLLNQLAIIMASWGVDLARPNDDCLFVCFG